MSEKQLIKKLSEVMKQVERIPKTGFNKFHQYHYATEADVNEAVRKELAERNVMMIPHVKSCVYREHKTAKGNTEYITTVEVEFTFMDGDTGEKIVFSSFGEGQDAGDKGVYKAVTGAQKYALMKAFMIPTGDDPEGDSGTDERNQGNQQQGAPQRSNGSKLSDPQVKRAFAIAKSNGITPEQVKQAIMRDYQKTEVADLTKQQYDELCSKMESVQKGDESA